MLSIIKLANIQWQRNQPYSLDFNDIYFSTDDGLQETEYVFIEQNQLKQRFASLENAHFTIIETGFGTGLNFLAVAAHWLALAPISAQLHYIGIERFPLKLADLIRAQASWPQFSAIANELAQYYATLKAGNNMYNLAEGRIQLDLQVDDVIDALAKTSNIADAWLLDGFAPAKNAEMWSSALFTHMAKLSKTGTTFATFTSASQVRRDLQAVGFKAQKHAGFGKKREMLAGVFTK
jgi:tRNA 5-methylaminomethyl-2-thiouridine biosynthesis bifunctional protein